MVGGRDVVRVLNCSAFHDTQLVCSGDLAYLGESWSKTIGCAVSFYISTLNFIYKLMSLLSTYSILNRTTLENLTSKRIYHEEVRQNVNFCTFGSFKAFILLD